MQIFERPRGTAVTPPNAAAAEAAPEPDLVVAATAAHAAVAAPPAESVASAAVGEQTPRAAAGAEEEDDERRGKFWREDKIGLLQRMQSEESTHDPCPQIPKTFLNPAHMSKLVRELKKRAPPQEEAAKDTDDPHVGDEALRANETRWEPPEVRAKHVVATRRSWAQFGPMVAAAAWALGFFTAARKAFVADGADNNWALHRRSCRSWISSMACRMCSRRPWRVAVSKKAGPCMSGGSNGCGPAPWTR